MMVDFCLRGLNNFEFHRVNFLEKWHLEFVKFLRRLRDSTLLGPNMWDQEEDRRQLVRQGAAPSHQFTFVLSQQKTSVLSQQQTSVLSQQQTSVLSQQKTSILSEQKKDITAARRRPAAVPASVETG